MSGLLAAREIAAGGLSVAVLEEDAEIGTPEHCGGLVSIAGVCDLGIVPDVKTIENDKIKYAKIFSRSNSFEINAQKQNVIVLDRRAFDKQIAFQAQKMGAELKVKCRVQSCSKDNSRYIVKTPEGDLLCDYFVDARGIMSIFNRTREGILQSAQYEVYAPWIERDTIEVAFDAERYPGFFAWIIPTGQGTGKVGAAGRHINAACALQSYLDSKGAHAVARKIYAPIWVNGPLQNFVYDRTILVGDAAGQSKPTTAGGIYSCGMGGLLAGQAIVRSASTVSKNNGDTQTLLRKYEKKWLSIFKTEFGNLLLARRLFERLDNKAIDELLAAVPPETLEEASIEADFDFHSSAVAKILGARAAAKMAKALLGNELRRHLLEGS